MNNQNVTHVWIQVANQNVIPRLRIKFNTKGYGKRNEDIVEQEVIFQEKLVNNQTSYSRQVEEQYSIQEATKFMV